MARQKVIVSLSGGVDSAVSLLLLKETNQYDIEALFIKNWDNLFDSDYRSKSKKTTLQIESVCSWVKDYKIAEKVAQQLNVKLHFVSFEKEYYQSVFQPLVREYRQGITPNPDIWCNRFIKFGLVLKYIKKKFACDILATGHYCQLRTIANFRFLHVSADSVKDQTYFLSGTPILNLQNVLFPIGALTKQTVRKIALQHELINSLRRDSTGICFIGERNFFNFLRQYIEPHPGPIIDFDLKKVIGTHLGLSCYTIGQRKQIKISGPFPYFVYRKDAKTRTLYVVSRRSNPLLWSKFISFKSLMVLFPIYFLLPAFPCLIRIRHQGKLYPAICYPLSSTVTIFNEKVFALAPGQIVVFYRHGFCLGSAQITRANKFHK